MSQRKRRQKEKAQDSSSDDANDNPKSIRRQASIFDAVAGRIGYDGFDERCLRRIKLRNGFPARQFDYTPLDVLLRRLSAPAQGPASVYLADEDLEAKQKLPESELLKAVHAYASDFYATATHDNGKCDFRSLDETALIAIGILLEEAATQVLGEAGDMVLTEPEGYDSVVPEARATQLQINGRVPLTTTPPYVSEVSDEEVSDKEEKRRSRKRMRPQNEDLG